MTRGILQMLMNDTKSSLVAIIAFLQKPKEIKHIIIYSLFTFSYIYEVQSESSQTGSFQKVFDVQSL